MKKKYGMKGVSECVLRIPVGKATVVCPFVNGNLQSREPIPASFTTDNPVVQAVIESCDQYKNNKIYLMATYGEDPRPEEAVESAKTVKKTVKKTTKPTPRTMEDVRTYGDAMTVLMTESEVNLSELTDVAACIKKAEELGITFPNLKA